jgi:hypothetical protein
MIHQISTHAEFCCRGFSRLMLKRDKGFPAILFIYEGILTPTPEGRT